MNAREFLDHHGTKVARLVADLAGTEYAYFQHIAMGRRFPSRALARRLADESLTVVGTRSKAMDFTALLLGTAQGSTSPKNGRRKSCRLSAKTSA